MTAIRLTLESVSSDRQLAIAHAMMVLASALKSDADQSCVGSTQGSATVKFEEIE
jgi:hypothetical protein